MTKYRSVRKRKRRQSVVFDPPLQFKTHSILPLPGSRLGIALRWLALLTAIGVMVLATSLTNRNVERFTVTDALFQHESFDAELADWEVNETEDGAVSVVEGVVGLAQLTDSANLNLSRDIKLEPGDKHLRLTGSVAGEDIVVGENNWEAARVIYLELDESGKHDRRKRHELVSLSGSEPLREYSADITLSESTKALRVSMQMFKTTGVMEISSLTLHKTELSTEYKASRFWLICGWLVILVWCLFWLSRVVRSAASRVFLLLAATVFIVGVLSPGSVNSRFFEWVEGAAGVSREHMEYAVHFIGFTIFGALLKLFQSHRQYFVLVAICLLVSGVSEVLQLLTLDRSLQYIDLLMNFSGAVLGVSIGIVIVKISRAIARWRYRRKIESLQSQEELAEDVELAYQENE